MIIKGTSHDNARNLARYLFRAKPGEEEFLMELRDSASDNIWKALTDWEAIAQSKTKGSKFLYHAHIRLRENETLNEAQWYGVIEQLETSLGFTNSARAIVGHIDPQKGLHLHVVWSRFDPVNNRLVSLSNDRTHHHAVARAAEKEFGFQAVPEKRSDRKGRLSDRDIRALKDRGINKDHLLKIVRTAWEATSTGEEMRAMLASLNVEIKPGDRRDWVVEYKGLKMNPVRLLEGVSAAQFRNRMKDVDAGSENEKTREDLRIGKMYDRKARHVVQDQIDRSFANNQPTNAKRTGFTQRQQIDPQLGP